MTRLSGAKFFPTLDPRGLAIYALALTRLVPGLRLFDIKCAWFNEHEYCEVFPRTLVAGVNQR